MSRSHEPRKRARRGSRGRAGFPPLAGFGAGPNIGLPGRSGAGVAGARLPRRVWGKAPMSAPRVSLEFIACDFGSGAVAGPGSGGESPGGGRGQSSPVGCGAKPRLRGVWAPTRGVGHDPGKGRTVGGRPFFVEKWNSVPLSAQRNFFLKNFFSMASPVKQQEEK